jgi:hypothetical protein
MSHLMHNVNILPSDGFDLNHFLSQSFVDDTIVVGVRLENLVGVCMNIVHFLLCTWNFVTLPLCYYSLGMVLC